MKKIIVLLVAVFVSGPLFAQTPGGDMRDIREAIELLKQQHEIKVNEQKLQKALEEAEEAVHKSEGKSMIKTPQEQFPTITMGKNKFVIEKAFKEDTTAGRAVWTYYYVPAKKPLVYDLDVIFSSGLPDADYYVTGRSNSLLVIGPLMWRKVGFEVSGIEINIYDDDRFERIREDWKTSFGEDCVFEAEKTISRDIVDCVICVFNRKQHLQSASLYHTPTSVYALEDGRTAVVSVYATSDYGPYKRKCSKWGMDVLFNSQPQFKKLKADAFPKMEYPVEVLKGKVNISQSPGEMVKVNPIYKFTSTATSK